MTITQVAEIEAADLFDDDFARQCKLCEKMVHVDDARQHLVEHNPNAQGISGLEEHFTTPGDASINWWFCTERANFVHKDACEFMLYIGPDSEFPGQESWEYFENTLKQMREYGCTTPFISAYEQAKEAGAMRVLFYA